MFDGIIFYNGRTRRLKQNKIQNVDLNITGRMYPENMEDDFTTGSEKREMSMICELKKIEIKRDERRRTKTYEKPRIQIYILEANKNNKNLPSIKEVSEEFNMG